MELIQDDHVIRHQVAVGCIIIVAVFITGIFSNSFLTATCPPGHVTINLGSHDCYSSSAVDGHVASCQTNIVGAKNLAKFDKFLVGKSFQWRGVDGI